MVILKQQIQKKDHKLQLTLPKLLKQTRREIKYELTNKKRIDNLFNEFETSSQLNKLYKNHFYEFWKPNLTEFLISSVELP